MKDSQNQGFMLHNLSQNLAYLCKDFGFNTADLALVMDVKEYKASAWVLGWLAPDAAELQALSQLFGQSIDELISKPINQQQNDWNLLSFSPFGRN